MDIENSQTFIIYSTNRTLEKYNVMMRRVEEWDMEIKS